MSRRVALVLVWMLLCALGPVSALLAQDPTFDATGFQKGRATFSQLPYEHVDTVSGNLILTFTDFVLPGNAGFDLRFERTFNSKSLRWTLGLAGLPLSVAPAVPTVLPNSQDPNDPGMAMPMLKTADGAEHKALWQNPLNTGDVLMTDDFWRYNCVTHTAELPNGLVVTFAHGDDLNRTISEVNDPFGNRVTFSADGQEITQFLGNGQTRTINITTTFNGPETDNGTLVFQDVSYLGRHWIYTSIMNSGIRQLTSAVSRIGSAWKYQYSGLELSSLTTPNGATISYTWRNHGFLRDMVGFPGVIVQSRVIATRTLGGREMPGGAWTYTFASENDNMLTVEGPGSTVVYLSGQTAGHSHWYTASRTVKDGSRTLQFEVWRKDEEVALAARPEPEYYVPLLTRHTVTRFDDDGTPHDYVTNYGYDSTVPERLKDFGRPNTVDEQGELHRLTSLNYEYDFGPYIRQRVKEETVTVGPETYTKHYDWDGDTGFLDGETIYGIHTTYTAGPFGNRASSTDAHPHRTEYTYSWGVLKDTKTPKDFWITRAVNSDGTIASETRNQASTTFTYDDLGRLKSSTASGRATAFLDYLLNAQGYEDSIAVRQGSGSTPSQTVFLLDGLGRTAGTNNTVGVHTRTGYDADGRRTQQSVPYSSEDKKTFTTFEYDALDRLKLVRNPDSSTVTYAYSGGVDVAITDEQDHVTTQDWRAFGDPADARLASVTDATNHTFGYEYNGLGRLTKATQPEGQARRWEYYPGQDLLKSDTQPEYGKVSFIYDGAGRLELKTDEAAGRSFAYGYDANDRQTSVTVNAGSGAHNVSYEYDEADNRTRLNNGSVQSTFHYWPDNLLKDRVDAIAGQDAAATTAYTYDEAGNLETIGYPSGLVVSYDYDRENRLERVSRGADTLVAEVLETHPSGAIQKLRYGNGVEEVFEIDDRRLWLRRVRGGPIDLTYDYYSNGNVRSVGDPRPGLSQSLLVYDAVDRLIEVQGFAARSFTYDKLGNRKTKTTAFGTTTYGYDDANTKRLVSMTGAESDAPTYEGNGNLQTSAGISYTYTPFNMVETATLQVAGSPKTDRYRYDGDGIRIVKEPADRPVEYSIHGAGGQLLSEFTLTGSHGRRWNRDYIYLGSRLVSAVAAPKAAVGFAAPAVTVSENAGSVVATVVMTTPDGAPLVGDLTVQFATADGSAAGGSDFTAQSGTLTFAAGTASGATRTITVGLVDSTQFEVDEQFTIVLSSASGGTIVGGTFTVTIVDNDPQLVNNIDTPLAGATVFTPFAVGGWAIDARATTGTGVDAVTLYARPAAGGTPISLGAATYGIYRGDVAAAYGPQFAASGYSGNIGVLAPGVYDIYAAAHFVSGSSQDSAPVRVTVDASELMSIDLPAAAAQVGQAFTVAGWAIDREAPAGTGVDQVKVTAFPAAGPPIELGFAAYGGERTDIASLFGERFRMSSFALTVTTLPPATYRIDVLARSTVTGTFSCTRSVTVTVRSDPRMSLDAPVHNSTVGQPILVAGWAVDLAAASGSGVDAIHVYAIDSQSNAIWLGTASYGIERSDIAGIFGERFRYSGFSLTATGLAPGTYQIYTYAHSVLTGTFNQAQSATVTIPTPHLVVSLDTPVAEQTVASTFVMGGWAIDTAHPTGSGVSFLHVYAAPAAGGPAIFLGAPATGGSRPDVGAIYGTRFTPSGWELVVSGLAPGTYTLICYPWSTVIDSFDFSVPPLTRVIHVQ